MSSADPRPVWTTRDLAERLGVGAEQGRRIANRADFPPPLFMHGVTRFWGIDDVEQWITEHRPDKPAE
ncbi:AlpA family transcriptional regulator [Frankia sp. ACN1ag]|uniref:helix-turn-helix transcriptional regulator n=1 Tax=Frankia sp. ACN1ag TaxID=102891 RepID=UPI0006DD2F70|nr:hypothetical protein [Frankia sp. ACN1ag]KQC39237.1 hypothetical protein UK82_06235 [Frankia sp. ACN1ag]